MKTLLVAVTAACLSGVVWGLTTIKLPAGKCRQPIPNLPGLNISKVLDVEFYYIATPNVFMYKMADSVKTKMEGIEGEEGVFLQTIKAVSVFKIPLDMQFKVKDLGNGVMKKITKDGEMSYYASIIAIKDNAAMVYVCSDDANTMQDMRYVIAPEGVDPSMIKDPDVLFKEENKKWNFTEKLRRLPQKLLNKVDLE